MDETTILEFIFFILCFLLIISTILLGLYEKSVLCSNNKDFDLERQKTLFYNYNVISINISKTDFCGKFWE